MHICGKYLHHLTSSELEEYEYYAYENEDSEEDEDVVSTIDQPAESSDIHTKETEKPESDMKHNYSPKDEEERLD